jgi:hypothetical protein
MSVDWIHLVHDERLLASTLLFHRIINGFIILLYA